MRKDTVYDLMKQKRTRGGDWQNLFKEEIIGKVVLTGYNNKTYKISDVDFNKKVSETFDFKGRVVSFNQYYEEKYKIKIVDTNQPLLVVNPSARDIRGGRTTIVNVSCQLFWTLSYCEFIYSYSVFSWCQNSAGQQAWPTRSETTSGKCKNSVVKRW